MLRINLRILMQMDCIEILMGEIFKKYCTIKQFRNALTKYDDSQQAARGCDHHSIKLYIGTSPSKLSLALRPMTSQNLGHI